MNKSVLIKITAAVALIFSSLTIGEGSLVLFKISTPAYTVFAPLLIYNILMGLAGFYVALTIWKNEMHARKYSLIVFVMHLTVFFISAIIYSTSDLVALDSVKAMALRSLIWFAVFFVVTKYNKSK